MDRIIGWGPILPQLAVFFALLPTMSQDELAAWNLFISGKPGTNKTKGAKRLPELLEYDVARVDSATLDDIADVVGVTDVRANREESRAGLIIGELVRAEVLILDEFPNVRPHVRTQMRLFFQGELVLQAQMVKLDTLTRIGTGNLSTDLLHGESGVIDSADADRFAVVVTAPSLSSMSKEDQIAIILKRENPAFENAFLQAVVQIRKNYDAAAAEWNEHTAQYVQHMLKLTEGTECEFEGRRAQILHALVVGGMALCRAQPDLDWKDAIWKITCDCLSYQRLTGQQIEVQKLRTSHDTAIAVMESNNIDALIAVASTLQEKIDMTVANLRRVTIITKSDVFSAVLGSDDKVLRIALRELVETPLFIGEPPDLAALVRRTPPPLAPGGIDVDPTQLLELTCMSRLESVVYEAAGGSKEEATVLLARVKDQLRLWGVAESG